MPATRYASLAGGVATDLVAWRRGSPSTPNTHLALRATHRATGGWSSRALQATLRALPGSVDHVARRDRSPTDEPTRRTVAALRADGLADIEPILDPADVARLVAFARTAPGRYRLDDGTRTSGTYGDPPPRRAALFIDGTFAWARPEVQRVMADEGLLRLVRHLVGMRPVVHPPALYWSFPTSATATAPGAPDQGLAQAFHWDYDGVAGVRLHLYLTDVDDDSGPMEYVRGSHRPGSLGWHRPGPLTTTTSDQYVTDHFPEEHWRRVIGPAGTTFLSDPHGLHRAHRPLTRERLFLVVPIQAGGFGGYVLRRRAVPARDPAFAASLAQGRPELRLFSAAAPGAVAATLAES